MKCITCGYLIDEHQLEELDNQEHDACCVARLDKQIYPDSESLEDYLPQEW